MKEKISIIVPIYNMEKYLPRCLDSIIHQTLQNIEVIAVNDGSTDNCLEILKVYQKKDNRIKIINKENEGVSTARNVGIQHATGDYIGFVDPDDWIETNMYEELYKIAVQSESDIVMCSYIREYGSHSKLKEYNVGDRLEYKGEKIKTEIVRKLIGPLDEELRNPEMLDAWGTVWSKIYRTELIKNYNITFEDLRLIGTNEDSLFNIYACYYAKKFVFLNRPYYHYWKGNENSITSVYKEALLVKWSNLFAIIEDFINDNNLGEKYKLALKNRIGVNALGLGFNEMNKKSNILKKWIGIHKLLNNDKVHQAVKSLELKGFPIVWKIFYSCARRKNYTSFLLLLASANFSRKIMK